MHESTQSQQNVTFDDTPAALRELVKFSVGLLGQVVRQAVEPKLYEQIDSIRKRMADLRDVRGDEAGTVLRSVYWQLRGLQPKQQITVARAYTLMLELVNTCENAYRSFRLSQASRDLQSSSLASVNDGPVPQVELPRAIVYVLTAHPTEARSPENIAVFHLIQRQLIAALERNRSAQDIQAALRHGLELAWRTPIVRGKSPLVSDEAQHIYSTLLEKTTLDSLLCASSEVLPVYVRSWVGGDKDGHPGVDEKVMQQSLCLSRARLAEFVQLHLTQVIQDLSLLGLKPLRADLQGLKRLFQGVRQVRSGDGARITGVRKHVASVLKKYKKEFAHLHPSLIQLRRLLHVFPGLVVPLELREASDVLMAGPNKKNPIAIDRMLKLLASIARGGDPTWYARGFIVSMTSEVEHLNAALARVIAAFGGPKIPVIPLFEQAGALKRAPEIMAHWLKSSGSGDYVREAWGGRCEMMVGYSDSSKESGVLASRIEIAEAMFKLDELCTGQAVVPIFFQGSGGSTDRGGGNVQDQISWWPHSAVRTYKVTVQGEMVERSLASPEITRGQIERIARSAAKCLALPSELPHLSGVREFAASCASYYRKMIEDPEFLEVVQKATPYLALGALRIGSRPSSRSSQLSVDGLRAIPWVLCWTQTRVLFPTWWGVGSSWAQADPIVRQTLKHAFSQEPVFASYVRALGFTLAKVELPIWRIYLENCGIESQDVERFYRQFEKEFSGACEMVRFISGHSELVWFKPWLASSIKLRASMIHPLNLLQIVALESKDPALLRLTVTGISSGMMTTG